VAPSELTDLNIKQVAAELGVHYMTAYRYVRTGRLAARKVGTGWVVSASDLAQFVERPLSLIRSEEVMTGANWRERLRLTLVIGDEMAAWRVVEQALAAGHSPTECYIDFIVGAINDISDRSQPPCKPAASEYLATATATRLVARLGARFRRPGRSRGTIVFGAPLGEHHVLPISVVADLVRLNGFNCLELGADVPPEAFAGAARDAYRLVAVGIGVTTATNLDIVTTTVAAVHAVDPEIPVVLGGQAAASSGATARTGVAAWASDGVQAIGIFTDLARARRLLWHGDDSSDTDNGNEGEQTA
jgi:excisionase family DNA binding protein